MVQANRRKVLDIAANDQGEAARHVEQHADGHARLALGGSGLGNVGEDTASGRRPRSSGGTWRRLPAAR